jgi:hypothetical protein
MINMLNTPFSPAARLQEERVLHEAKLSKMEAEMKMVFQQKVQEKEAKLKQSEEELYARHQEMKDALNKQRADLEDKKRRIESGRPLTPEKNSVSIVEMKLILLIDPFPVDRKEERIPSSLRCLCLTAEKSFSTTYFPGFSLTILCRHYYPLFSLHFLTLILSWFSSNNPTLFFFFARICVALLLVPLV